MDYNALTISIITACASPVLGAIGYQIRKRYDTTQERQARHRVNMQTVGTFCSHIHKDTDKYAEDMANITSMLYVQYAFSLKDADIQSANTRDKLVALLLDKVINTLTYKDLV